MPSITITLSDTPAGGVAITSNFRPAVGEPCTAAQATALDIMARTNKEWGTRPASFRGVPFQVGDAEHGRLVDALKKLPPMQERGR